MTTFQIVGAGVVALILFGPPMCAQIRVPRLLADQSLEAACRSEGGLKVLEPTVLGADEAKRLAAIPAAILNAKDSVLDAYDFKSSYTNDKSFGVGISKYSRWIERKADKKRLSEYTYFVRDGYDVVMQANVCPKAYANEDLVSSTFGIGAAK